VVAICHTKQAARLFARLFDTPTRPIVFIPNTRLSFSVLYVLALQSTQVLHQRLERTRCTFPSSRTFCRHVDECDSHHISCTRSFFRQILMSTCATGATLVTNACVAEIEIEQGAELSDGCVRGVRLTTGETLSAGCVLSNATPKVMQYLHCFAWLTRALIVY
jgi:hypothetical protein